MKLAKLLLPGRKFPNAVGWKLAPDEFLKPQMAGIITWQSVSTFESREIWYRQPGGQQVVAKMWAIVRYVIAMSF